MTTIAQLRPDKIRSGVRRRWFERQLHGYPLDPRPDIEQIGTPYGGWTMPTDAIQDGWTCYCIGAGGDIEFEHELLRRWDVRVRCVEAMKTYLDRLEPEASDPRLSLHHAAIDTADGPLRMQLTHHPGSLSVSADGLYDGSDYYEAPGRTLPSLMAELGDDHIDLLKLDIEGGEYRVVPQLDLVALGVKIFATQLHHTGSVRDARRLIDGVRRQGFRPVGMRSAVKITFLRDAT